MDTKLKVQTTDVTVTVPRFDAVREPKPAWHAPVITRIDIKRTMGAGGSALDESEGSQF